MARFKDTNSVAEIFHGGNSVMNYHIVAFLFLCTLSRSALFFYHADNGT